MDEFIYCMKNQEVYITHKIDNSLRIYSKELIS